MDKLNYTVNEPKFNLTRKSLNGFFLRIINSRRTPTRILWWCIIMIILNLKKYFKRKNVFFVKFFYRCPPRWPWVNRAVIWSSGTKFSEIFFLWKWQKKIIFFTICRLEKYTNPSFFDGIFGKKYLHFASWIFNISQLYNLKTIFHHHSNFWSKFKGWKFFIVQNFPWFMLRFKKFRTFNIFRYSKILVFRVYLQRMAFRRPQFFLFKNLHWSKSYIVYFQGSISMVFEIQLLFRV